MNRETGEGVGERPDRCVEAKGVGDADAPDVVGKPIGDRFGATLENGLVRVTDALDADRGHVTREDPPQERVLLFGGVLHLVDQDEREAVLEHRGEAGLLRQQGFTEKEDLVVAKVALFSRMLQRGRCELVHLGVNTAGKTRVLQRCREVGAAKAQAVEADKFLFEKTGQGEIVPWVEMATANPRRQIVVDRGDAVARRQQPWDGQKAIHESVNGVDEVRIAKQALPDVRAAQAMRDLIARHVGVRENADAAGSAFPLAREDRQLRHDKRGLAAAGAGRDVQRGQRLQERAPLPIKRLQLEQSASPLDVVIGDGVD